MITKTQIKLNYQKRWWKDGKIISSVALIFCTAMQIFAFLEIEFFTTFHRYTVGVLLGWYNPFLYLLLIFVAFKTISQERFKNNKWIKLSYLSYSLISISIILFSVSMNYVLKSETKSLMGKEVWEKIFSNWWKEFKSSDDPWLPKATNGGIIGSFFYCMFAFWSKSYGAIVFASLFIIISLSTLYYKKTFNLVGLIFSKMFIFIKKGFKKKKDKEKVTNEIPKEEITNNKSMADLESQKVVEDHLSPNLENKKSNKANEDEIDDSLFDDSFNV